MPRADSIFKNGAFTSTVRSDLALNSPRQVIRASAKYIITIAIGVWTSTYTCLVITIVEEYNNPPIIPNTNWHRKVYEIKRLRDYGRHRKCVLVIRNPVRYMRLFPGPLTELLTLTVEEISGFFATTLQKSMMVAQVSGRLPTLTNSSMASSSRTRMW